MARVGFGHSSSINRISSYRSASSRTGRSYRGVHTGKMVADMGLRLQKANDTSMKNQFNAGKISTNDYQTYLTSRIGQTADPTYQVQLTNELQNLTTTSNDQQILDQHKAGQLSAGQLEQYYQSKLQGLTPGNPDYAKTQAAIKQWGDTANKESYKAQEAVLHEQYLAAADKIGPAQKLLDYNIQYLQKLTPQDPEYQQVMSNIGSLQGQVQKMQNIQDLYKAEAAISDQFKNANSHEALTAKAQMFAQLRDAAAAQGNTDLFYKYDQMANDTQGKAQSAQINDGIRQIHEQYLSGKIDGATAQSLLEQATSLAGQYGDTAGAINAQTMWNSIDHNITKGITYGGDNGFGRSKGGSGGSGGTSSNTFNFTSGTIAPSSAKPGTDVAQSNTPGTSGFVEPDYSKGSTGGSLAPRGDVIAQIEKMSNSVGIAGNQNLMSDIHTQLTGGASVKDVALYVQAQKVGTSDGYQAVDKYYKSQVDSAQKALNLGYDPETMQPFGPDQYKAVVGNAANYAAQAYTAWQGVIEQNPNAKININGKNVKLATLATKIDKQLNGGGTKIVDGIVTKDSTGLLDTIQQMTDPNNTAPFVEVPGHPGQFYTQDKAAMMQQKGLLKTNYIPDEHGVFRYVYQNTPVGKTSLDAQGNKVTTNTQDRTVVLHGLNGQSITYHLDNSNNVVRVEGSKGALPPNFQPVLPKGGITSFGGAQLQAPNETNTRNGQGLTQTTFKTNVANGSKMFTSGDVRAAKVGTPLTGPLADFNNKYNQMHPATGLSDNTQVPRVGQGSAYNPSQAAPGLSVISPGQQPKPTFMSGPSTLPSIAPQKAPMPVFNNPVDVLIHSITNPNTQGPRPQAQQPQPAFVPSTGNAYQSNNNNLYNAGRQPANTVPNNNQPQHPVQGLQGLPNIPRPDTNTPLSQFFGNVGQGVMNVGHSIGSAVGNLFGGFHF